MFYSTFVLQKKGPFAKLWIAAHWDKKLTKHDIRLVDISESVVSIVNPTVPMALRTSGELMLGVVRIYSHKVKFLLQEAQTATVRIKSLELSSTGKDNLLPPPKPSLTEAFEEFDYGRDQTLFFFRHRMEDEPPPRLEELGDLDDWFQIPPEQTFEQSQDLSFQLPRGPSPKPSEVDTESTVSSTERLRDAKGTPIRPPEEDLAVPGPLEDLFSQMPAEVLPEAPPAEAPVLDAGATPTPQPVIPEDEAVAPPPKRRMEKIKRLEIDKSTMLSSAFIKRRLEDTSDIVRPEVYGPMTRHGLEVKAWEGHDFARRFQLPVSAPELPPTLLEAWSRCVAGGAEAEADVEAARQDGSRREEEAAVGAVVAAPEEELPAPFPPVEEPPLPPPLDETPHTGRKRRGDDVGTPLPKRPRGAGVDLAATAHHTLRRVRAALEGKPRGVGFASLTAGASRCVTATRFYDLLVLKKFGMVDVAQKTPYADITITATRRLNEDLHELEALQA
eukprot:TRINITY_DN9453_c0_g1_i1.p1 TRINITY_DN9453_c0_g1~~TRINITY_DN9453_c0_g1_i1.p1  ORF type:complete len:502 (-),score=96.58 TRINITY_DN9453_c0_g1_i1:160-1665(-)